MVDPPCPQNWDYENVPNYKNILKVRNSDLLTNIRNATSAAKLRVAKDTRRTHHNYFAGLTPAGFPYFAGHYRGERFRCLDSYEVRIQSDPRVGHTAATVPMEMDVFSAELERSSRLIDFHMGVPNVIVSEPTKLVAYVHWAAALFVYFLEIHPYANGNGHMARTMLLCLIGRLDVYPTRDWNIDPKPADPPYSNLIALYRNGDREPLVRFILDAL